MLILIFLYEIYSTYYTSRFNDFFNFANTKKKEISIIRNYNFKSDINQFVNVNNFCKIVLKNAMDDINLIQNNTSYLDHISAKILCDDVIFSIINSFLNKEYVYMPKLSIINLHEKHRPSYDSIMSFSFDFMKDLCLFNNFDNIIKTLKHDKKILNKFIKSKMFWRFTPDFIPYVSYTSPIELHLYVNIDSDYNKTSNEIVSKTSIQDINAPETSIYIFILLSNIISIIAIVCIFFKLSYNYYKRNRIASNDDNNLILQNFYRGRY